MKTLKKIKGIAFDLSGKSTYPIKGGMPGNGSGEQDIAIGDPLGISTSTNISTSTKG